MSDQIAEIDGITQEFESAIEVDVKEGKLVETSALKDFNGYDASIIMPKKSNQEGQTVQTSYWRREAKSSNGESPFYNFVDRLTVTVNTDGTLVDHKMETIGSVVVMKNSDGEQPTPVLKITPITS